jgi:hypothetical protein
MTIAVATPALSRPEPARAPSGDIHHQLTIERFAWQPRKELCATLAELDRVIDDTIKWKCYNWEDTTHSLVRRIEFSGEALEKIMQAGLESLARKRTRQKELKSL